MMLSVYVTLGIFLLLAARNPSANRSLIAFTAWSSIAHAAVMAVQSFYMASERGELLFAVAALGIIGVALIVLAPIKQSGERVSAAVALARTLEKQPTSTSRTKTNPSLVRKIAVVILSLFAANLGSARLARLTGNFAPST